MQTARAPCRSAGKGYFGHCQAVRHRGLVEGPHSSEVGFWSRHVSPVLCNAEPVIDTAALWKAPGPPGPAGMGRMGFPKSTQQRLSHRSAFGSQRGELRFRAPRGSRVLFQTRPSHRRSSGSSPSAVAQLQPLIPHLLQHSTAPSVRSRHLLSSPGSLAVAWEVTRPILHGNKAGKSDTTHPKRESLALGRQGRNTFAAFTHHPRLIDC